MQRSRPGDGVERPVDRRHREAPCLLRACLQPRLVDLDHIRPGGFEVAGFGVDRRGVIHDQLFLFSVEFVFRLP
jgi:hypothetical protein